ncbi:unnamed protein product [Bemisia tabaci]|uniref:Uncharacterized protein n=1 Tax=Bemisia tabaci TaxID=7038 RepID=A0A9P0F6M7_BEMTA|nr:unnamed protein product [Bemisia tabaci]
MKIKRNEVYSWLGNSDPDEMIERRAEEEKALCVAFHSKRSNFSPANFPPFDNSYCVNFRAFKLLNFASTRFASPPSRDRANKEKSGRVISFKTRKNFTKKRSRKKTKSPKYRAKLASSRPESGSPLSLKTRSKRGKATTTEDETEASSPPSSPGSQASPSSSGSSSPDSPKSPPPKSPKSPNVPEVLLPSSKRNSEPVSDFDSEDDLPLVPPSAPAPAPATPVVAPPAAPASPPPPAPPASAPKSPTP